VIKKKKLFRKVNVGKKQRKCHVDKPMVRPDPGRRGVREVAHLKKDSRKKKVEKKTTCKVASR